MLRELQIFINRGSVGPLGPINNISLEMLTLLFKSDEYFRNVTAIHINRIMCGLDLPDRVDLSYTIPAKNLEDKDIQSCTIEGKIYLPYLYRFMPVMVDSIKKYRLYNFTNGIFGKENGTNFLWKNMMNVIYAESNTNFLKILKESGDITKQEEFNPILYGDKDIDRLLMYLKQVCHDAAATWAANRRELEKARRRRQRQPVLQLSRRSRKSF